MKVKFWTFCRPNGDGSSAVLFFRTEPQARAYYEAEMNSPSGGEGNEEDINQQTLEFDDKGKLLTIDKYENLDEDLD